MAYLPAATLNNMVTGGFPTATTQYVSLHSASPSTTGANEISGGSYARQSLSWASVSGGSQASSNAQTFSSMPSVTIGWFGYWSASTAGTYNGGGALSSSLTVPSGATVSAAIGAFTAAVTG